MVKIQINGLSFNIESTGNGPAIVALHGFTGSTKTWDEFVIGAKDRYTVITIDLLGHGQSDSPTNSARYDISNCINDVKAILTNLHVERTNWLGYSMGGRVALALALALPERTASLMLESASPGLSTLKERSDRIQQDSELADWIIEVGIKDFVQYWENLPLFSSQNSLPASQQKAHRAQRLTNSSVGLANSLRGIGTGIQPPVHQQLDKINFPTLMICGNLDLKFNRIAQEMHNSIQGSQFQEIRNAGHAPHFEKPYEFNQCVLEFLNSTNEIHNRASASTVDPLISNLWSR
jgi:2-succinyl-6-hydroxy-2,4-cyclohexadiene-1-carboxylate synthase